jgi:transmembrane sensor
MRASPQLPADAATRGTLFDRARQQGMAQELTDLVVVEVRKQEQRKRKITRGVGLLALLLGVGLWAVPYYRSTDTISTRTANRQTLALSDGSRADLNAQTQLKIDFRYGRRLVHLTEGEAFFTVAKDAEHPFLVETPAGTVQVTGTQFNVRLSSDKSAEVTLLEGSVAISTPGAGSSRVHEISPVALAPGEQVTLADGRPDLRMLTPSALESVTAWRDGRLILDELTVAEAAARMSRYHGKRINVDPEAGTVRLGGSCPLDDLPSFLQSLKATQKLTILDNRDGSYRVLLRQP